MQDHSKNQIVFHAIFFTGQGNFATRSLKKHPHVGLPIRISSKPNPYINYSSEYSQPSLPGLIFLVLKIG
jgi:hypothetical protein